MRIATYNASLYGKSATGIKSRLSDGDDRHAANVASIVQTVRPDVLLVNELDYDADQTNAKLLNEKFFAVAHGDLAAIKYPYVYGVPSNTGVGSGLDLDNNQKSDGPADAWGFGRYLSLIHI